MKIKLFTLAFMLSFFVSYSQSNKDNANVYLKRAKEAIEISIDYETALTYFNKAMKFTDTIVDRKIAHLGSKIYYEVHHKQESLQEQLKYLETAQDYSKQYFLLAKNKASEEYINNTEEYVLISETIEEVNNEIKAENEEKLRKEKEIRRIDSLKATWSKKSESLSIKADSLYKFNKNGFAIIEDDNSFGLLNDLGETIINTGKYADVLQFDGFFIFKNKKDNSTKIFTYDSSTKVGTMLPAVSDFSTLSTNYGKVMLPRGNGRVVTYPNNAKEPLIYDVTAKKFVRVANQEEVLKGLKKADVIDKYNKDGEVKVNKEWYAFGGHLGGGIHPLYSLENYDLKYYLCSIDGNLIDATADFSNIGYFYQNKYQAIKNNKTVWINQNGTKVSDAKSEAASYNGDSKVRKLASGTYQILRDNMIIKGDDKLQKMAEFLRQNSGN